MGLDSLQTQDFEIAEQKDVAELYDLQLRAFESEAEMIGSRNVPALMETYEHSCKDFNSWTTLVRRDETGRIIGAVRFQPVDGHIEIGRLMVAPEHRNRGMAMALMCAVEDITGADIFELYTCTRSTININLYEKLGYRAYKEEKGEEDLSFVYMRKSGFTGGNRHE